MAATQEPANPERVEPSIVEITLSDADVILALDVPAPFANRVILNVMAGVVRLGFLEAASPEISRVRSAVTLPYATAMQLRDILTIMETNAKAGAIDGLKAD